MEEGERAATQAFQRQKTPERNVSLVSSDVDLLARRKKKKNRKKKSRPAAFNGSGRNGVP